MIFLRVITLELMFICRNRFPRNKSIADVIRKRYGQQVVISIRKFEKLDFRYRKIILDLEFLNTCSQKKVIPKFLIFRLAAKHTRPKDYLKYQVMMLNDEIKSKQKHLNTVKNQLLASKDSLRNILSVVDFAHVCSVFLCGNDHRLNNVRTIHDKNYTISILICRLAMILVR